MKEKFNKFMYGRNGPNELSKFLIIISFISIVVSYMTKEYFSIFLNYFGFITLIYANYIVFSRKIEQRKKQNQEFLYFTKKITNKFKNLKVRITQRKNYKFYKCENCKTILRVPKGKGNIKIKCTNCGHTMIKKS